MTRDEAAEWINANLPVVAVPDEDTWRLVAGAVATATGVAWADVWWSEPLSGTHPYHLAEGEARELPNGVAVGDTAFLTADRAPDIDPDEWPAWKAHAEKVGATLERLREDMAKEGLA